MIVGVRRGPKLVEMSIDDGSGELLSCVLWESSAEAWRQLPDEATELLCGSNPCHCHCVSWY